MTIQTFVGRVITLLNMLSSFVVAVFPRSKCLLISWLQSPSAVIQELEKINSVGAFPGLLGAGHHAKCEDHTAAKSLYQAQELEPEGGQVARASVS